MCVSRTSPPHAGHAAAFGQGRVVGRIDAWRNGPRRHTRHEPGTEASRYVSCHMPRIAEALLFKARSHEIDDVPDAAMTARFGNEDSPNACLSCHRDRDAAWLQLQMATRFRRSK